MEARNTEAIPLRRWRTSGLARLASFRNAPQVYLEVLRNEWRAEIDHHFQRDVDVQ